MAVNPYPALKFKIQPLFSDSTRFQRREQATETKKIQRKLRVKIRHVLSSLILVTGVFVGVQQGLLFLMGWDHLIIRHIEVSCPKPELKAAAERWLHEHVGGNLWVLDIQKVRRAMEPHPWIKSVRVRKHFPSTLRVEIQERIPAALLQKDSLTLIDREGVELASVPPASVPKLPIFVDRHGFRIDREEKLDSAWRFLDQLTTQDRDSILRLDVTHSTDLRAKRRDFPAWLWFGKGECALKMANFHTERAFLESRLPLEYVDLSRTDRVVFKTLAADPGISPAPERR